MDKHLYKNELTGYFLNLGIFVQEFAQVESVLFNAVKMAANIELPTARVLLSGAKSDLLRKHLKKLAPDLDIDVIAALDHFGEITTARNKILHNGADLIPNGIKVSRHIKDTGVEVVREMSPSTLQALTNDTKLVRKIISYKYLIPSEMNKDKAEDLKFKDFVENIAKELTPAWQYKPPKQSGSRRNPNVRPPKPSNPPQP